jgi:hypothetical protein
MVFNGSNAKSAHGDLVASIKTFLAWIKPDDITTRSIIDIDGGTHSVEIDGSSEITATGWSSPTIYVNSDSSSAAIASSWKHIAVTTATAIDCSDCDIGQEASWYDGEMAIVKLLEYQLNQGQIRNIFESEKHLFGVK